MDACSVFVVMTKLFRLLFASTTLNINDKPNVIIALIVFTTLKQQRNCGRKGYPNN